MTRSRRLAYFALLGNVVIWGAALPIIKPALDVITPFYFLQLRYLVACVFLLPLLPFIWPKASALKQIKTILPIEFIHVVLSLIFLYQGLARTSALTASLIGSASPIFVTLGGIIFLKEREEKREWLGLGISLIGTLGLIITSSLTNDHSANSTLGIIYLTLYHLANTTYLMLAKRHYHDTNKMFITTLGAILGAVCLSVLAPLFGPTPSVALLVSEPAVVFAVLYMGMLGTPIAVSLLLYGQSKIEVSEATLFTYLQPLIYIPLSVFWLGDTLAASQFLGLSLITGGVFLAELRPRRRRRPRHQPTPIAS